MFPLFELVKIFDLDLLYRIPARGTQDDGETEQAIDALASPDIKLYATSDVGERSLLAVICTDGENF